MFSPSLVVSWSNIWGPTPSEPYWDRHCRHEGSAKAATKHPWSHHMFIFVRIFDGFLCKWFLCKSFDGLWDVFGMRKYPAPRIIHLGKYKVKACDHQSHQTKPNSSSDSWFSEAILPSGWEWGDARASEGWIPLKKMGGYTTPHPTPWNSPKRPWK